MTLLRRFLCWDLRTATVIGYITTTVTAIFALLMRALDVSAIANYDFEISQGFHTAWRSHQWQAFLASDVILLVFHVGIIIFSVYMSVMVSNRHFVMYMRETRWYLYFIISYVFIEFCFSLFEFSYYGLNTFRLSFVVFLWLYWLVKTCIYICFSCVLYSRYEQMADEMAMELRFSEKKYSHSYA
ncbi:uncharacterized protein LOC124151381 [Haliotis rufescens]|uniref:uncharacterized protein LOC124151381 n=1 Tax=Haliotis rufescens TaxID=6454 RepID=UPI00201ECC47|nr:uncharacterized protein LOC124151381 [Haliotis rufescens]